MSEDGPEYSQKPTSKRRAIIRAGATVAAALITGKYIFDRHAASQQEVDESKAKYAQEGEFYERGLKIKHTRDIEAFFPSQRFSQTQQEQMLAVQKLHRDYFQSNPRELADYQSKLKLAVGVWGTAQEQEWKINNLDQYDWRIISAIFHSKLEPGSMVVEAGNLFKADQKAVQGYGRTQLKPDQDQDRMILLAYYWQKMMDQFKDRGLAYAAFRYGEGHVGGMLRTRFSNQDREKANIIDLVQKEIVPAEVRDSYIKYTAIALED